MTKKRECKDCRSEGRTGPILNAPYPGPRCHRHHQAHRKAVREAAAGKRRASVYRITPAQYRAILEAQNGVCAWCLRPPRSRRLAVDHDHSCCPGDTSCGECVRGLLCWSCNKTLHHLGDDPELVHRGWEYLRNPPAHIALRAGNV